MKRRRRGVAALAVLATLAGCGSQKVAPSAPAVELPPVVDAVYPAARSAGVAVDTDIWVSFTEPLDSTSVNAGNVFLKIDTRRQTIAVSWESALRRIRIRPQSQLKLSETYTVELGAQLATADGGPLGQTYFWQFTVSGLRRFGTPGPASGTLAEAPYAPLVWTGTEASAGDVVYDVRAAADSATAAAPPTPPLQRTTQSFYVPGTAWPAGSTVYWGVTAINRTSRDTLASPVWRFDVVAAGAPIDSVTYYAGDWGYYSRSTRQSICFDSRLFAGPTYNNGVSWSPGVLGISRRLAVAYVTFYSAFANTGGPSLGTITDPYRATPCALGYPGPPYPVSFVASGNVTAPQTVVFQSEALTAAVQAGLRGLPIYGFSLSANANTTYNAPPQLTLYYYR